MGHLSTRSTGFKPSVPRFLLFNTVIQLALYFTVLTVVTGAIQMRFLNFDDMMIFALISSVIAIIDSLFTLTFGWFEIVPEEKGKLLVFNRDSLLGIYQLGHQNAVNALIPFIIPLVLSEPHHRAKSTLRVNLLYFSPHAAQQIKAWLYQE
ncbi:hypothetical protein [Shewanella sp. GXUN23E]|uniref:hypothetical protein n=1 Tax=Shewanella sp. GXUN23E TaxID=3422498 RepID=UPI003D7E44BF